MDKLNEKLVKYFDVTKRALEKVKLVGDLSDQQKTKALDILDLSKRYYEDAVHFNGRNDFVNAFGAVVYSHAFLDIGCRLELFDVDDNELFMVD
tara:strand:+ start:1260 stop:1541 length:282 start_codon:yes stop_codon:yes gene_type:complete